MIIPIPRRSGLRFRVPYFATRRLHDTYLFSYTTSYLSHIPPIICLHSSTRVVGSWCRRIHFHHFIIISLLLYFSLSSQSSVCLRNAIRLHISLSSHIVVTESVLLALVLVVARSMCLLLIINQADTLIHSFTHTLCALCD